MQGRRACNLCDFPILYHMRETLKNCFKYLKGAQWENSNKWDVCDVKLHKNIENKVALPGHENKASTRQRNKIQAESLEASKRPFIDKG